MVLRDYEIKIIRLMSQQLSSKEIGEKLGLSARTVEDYKGILFKKVGVKNAVGMVMYGISEGP